jgi:hypothetical protein
VIATWLGGETTAVAPLIVDCQRKRTRWTTEKVDGDPHKPFVVVDWERPASGSAQALAAEKVCSNVIKTHTVIDQAVVKESASTDEALSLDAAKGKCAELGFTPATEAFGKCVIQLSK